MEADDWVVAVLVRGRREDADGAFVRWKGYRVRR